MKRALHQDANPTVAKQKLRTQRRLLLNGDIGGTNSRLQLWLLNDDVLSNECICDRRYPSRDFQSLDGLLRCFLGDAGVHVPSDASVSNTTPVDDIDSSQDVVAVCCIALCGPIKDERCSMGPVLPEQGPTGWGADIRRDVCENLGKVVARAVLINDCVATGLGLTALDPEDVRCLHKPTSWTTDLPPMLGEPMAAVVVGTGLGAVYLTADNGAEYQAHPSEGGMTEYQVRPMCLPLNKYQVPGSILLLPGAWLYTASTSFPTPY